MSEAGAVINNNAFFSDNAKMKICAGGAAVAIMSALALTAFLVISNGDPMNCMRDQIGTFTSTGLIVAGGAISAVASRSLSPEDGEEDADARSRAASVGDDARSRAASVGAAQRGVSKGGGGFFDQKAMLADYGIVT